MPVRIQWMIWLAVIQVLVWAIGLTLTEPFYIGITTVIVVGLLFAVIIIGWPLWRRKM